MCSLSASSLWLEGKCSGHGTECVEHWFQECSIAGSVQMFLEAAAAAQAAFDSFQQAGGCNQVWPKHLLSVALLVHV